MGGGRDPARGHPRGAGAEPSTPAVSTELGFTHRAGRLQPGEAGGWQRGGVAGTGHTAITQGWGGGGG